MPKYDSGIDHCRDSVFGHDQGVIIYRSAFNCLFMKEFEVRLKCKYTPGKGVDCKVIEVVKNPEPDVNPVTELEPVKECAEV